MISISRIAEDDTLRSDPTFFKGVDEISGFLKENKIETFPLKEAIIDIRNGSDVKQTDYSLRPSDYVYVSVSEIRDNGLDLTDPTFLREECGSDRESLSLRDGDIIITRSGTVGIGYIFQRLDSRIYIPSGYTIVLRVNEEMVFPPFLVYYLNSSLMKTFFNTHSSGKNTQNITQKVIGKMPFPTLSISQQREIYESLKLISGEIVENLQKIPNMQTMIQKSFESRLNFLPLEEYFSSRTVMFNLSFSDIAKNRSLRSSAKYNYFWKFYDGEVIKTKNGANSRRVREFMKVSNQEILKKGYLNGEYILLDKEDVEPKTGNIVNEEKVVRIESDKVRFGDSDILISKIDPFLGHVILNDKTKPYIGTTEFVPYVVNSHIVDLKFVQYLFLSRDFLELSQYIMAGKRQPRINPPELLSLKFPIPEKDVQDQVVKEIQNIMGDTVGIRTNLKSLKRKFDEKLISCISR